MSGAVLEPVFPQSWPAELNAPGEGTTPGGPPSCFYCHTVAIARGPKTLHPCARTFFYYYFLFYQVSVWGLINQASNNPEDSSLDLCLCSFSFTIDA